jgi:hypothetical protein
MRSPAFGERGIDMTSADTTRIKMVLLVVMKRQVATIKAVVAVLALCVSVLGLAACGGETGQQEEAQQAPQKAAPSSSGAGRGLVGTWEATESDLGPELGGGLLTFSEDGTFQAQPLPVDAPDLILSGEYSVDASHITFIDSEGGETQSEYTLEGDTLTTRTPEATFDPVTTYKRKS